MEFQLYFHHCYRMFHSYRMFHRHQNSLAFLFIGLQILQKYVDF